jgi:hypothetical protein
MATLTEGRHNGEFIGELALGQGYHCDQVTILSGQNLVAGAVVGRQTTGGKYVAYDNAGTDDGRRTVAGILVGAVNASGGDAIGLVLRRGPAMVNKNDLTWASGVDASEQAAAITEMLTLLGIKAV